MGDFDQKVKFDLGTGRMIGKLIKDNGETVVVEFFSERDRQTIQIKRHKEKHHVQFLV